MSVTIDVAALSECVERVSKKQKVTMPKLSKDIDDIIGKITECRKNINAIDEAESNAENVLTHTASLNVALLASKQTTKIIADHKELHAPISKLGKIVDKSFRTDIEKSTSSEIQFDPKLVQEMMVQHFYRQGQFDIGDALVEETHVDLEVAQKLKAPFVEMFAILQRIRERQLDTAIEWAVKKTAALSKMNSNLEFRLHRLKFIDFLTANKRAEALAYAKLNFPRYSNHQLIEITHLMGAFAYAGRLDRSPYAGVFHSTKIAFQWSDIATHFTRDCCALIGLPQQSPLHVVINAGFKALPTYIKLAAFQVLKASEAGIATVETDLGDQYQFHSVFSCPVSREQSTKENPPVLLLCGHVLCKNSMLKLVKSGSRFKCPYCPSEQLSSQVRTLIF